jgi:tetratricopeptide (TPR) repeat protein
MKTLSMLAFLCVCSIVLVAQDKPATPDEKLFDAAAKRFEDGDYLTAAVEFEQMIKQFPKSKLVARAHFNRALCYYLFKDYETSEEIFLAILNEDYNEKDPNSLMEPYALYKHNTCRYLAHMALEKKDFVATEKYIELFDKKYPYQHFCGNEWSAYHMYVDVMRAKVYMGTGQVKKAMDILLPSIFFNGLASNEDVLVELERIIDQAYSKEQAGAEFKQALASFTFKKEKKQTSATIELYGIKINVRGFEYFDEDSKKLSEEERYRQTVVNNVLFKKYL